uniref:EF-hand domain-containing protein n=2 Tax=Haptolina brevifila TaxID=156173 RepID=A0A7S2BAX5_9EUKA|mmetsp:Transcript_10904/g.22081  ORF Transcript_10904/g.22081 Transcript_10904/m.22081 type:complete len:521 (+) Transcript_10904:147-1709(+)
MAAAAHAAIRKSRARPPGLALDVEKVFDEFDTDGSGDMNLKELTTALGKLQIKASDSQIESLMARFSAPNATSLDIVTFNDLVSALRGPKSVPATPNKGGRTELSQPESSVASVSRGAPAAPLKESKWSMICNSGENRLPGQRRVLAFYQHPLMVYLVAMLIMSNFIINIVEKEIDPSSVKYKDIWNDLDTAFNAIFLAELVLNMYSCGGPFLPFWRSGWNCFDFVIVMIGMILMGGNLPASLSKLKLLRAFRIFRLFKRIKSLNQIVVAIVRSMPGVFNAFIIMLIFFCIYAILAVDLFRDFGDTSTATYTIYDSFEYANYSIPGDETSPATLGVFSYRADASAITTRGLHIGSEYYGTFFRALFTLFQVMTGESWSEAIARPLLFGLDSNNGVIVTLYYVSFILIMQFVLINVVVAVLLDKFVQDEQHAEPSEELHEDAVANLLGGGAPAAAAPAAERDLKHVQVTVAAPPAATTPSPSLLDAKLDAILAELKDLKNDLAATRSEIFNIKEARGSLAV